MFAPIAEPSPRRTAGRERRFLDLVLALQKIDGIGLAGFDLFANLGRRSRQNASRMAETMLLAKSVLIRSSAFASCPK